MRLNIEQQCLQIYLKKYVSLNEGEWSVMLCIQSKRPALIEPSARWITAKWKLACVNLCQLCGEWTEQNLVSFAVSLVILIFLFVPFLIDAGHAKPWQCTSTRWTTATAKLIFHFILHPYLNLSARMRRSFWSIKKNFLMLSFSLFFYYCHWDTSIHTVQIHHLLFNAQNLTMYNINSVLFLSMKKCEFNIYFFVVVDKWALVHPATFTLLRRQRDLKQDG